MMAQRLHVRSKRRRQLQQGLRSPLGLTKGRKTHVTATVQRTGWIQQIFEHAAGVHCARTRTAFPTMAARVT